MVSGHNVDGVIVDDQRRSERHRFRWPPKYTIYVYGALGGAVVQAGILNRFGLNAWHWSDDAIRRAVEWMYDDRDGKKKWDTCNDADKRYVLDLVDTLTAATYVGLVQAGTVGPGRHIA